MKAIGGYFELELPDNKWFPHCDGLLVNSGRNGIEAILRSLPVNSEVLIPKYTCEVVLEPFISTGISHIFYDINENLELTVLPSLKSSQFLLYTNYFGVKDRYADELASIYGNRLIIDDSQALFHEPTNESSTVYSYRKFVGVPDGAAVVSDLIKDIHPEPATSFGRCSHLLKRIDLGPTEGYPDFTSNDNALKGNCLSGMSNLTKRLLRSVDWISIESIRKENFNYLHKTLGKYNLLEIPAIESFQCPMTYPFRSSNKKLRNILISRNIFVPTLWPNVLEDCNSDSTEYNLADTIVPIPIDQRYGVEEMQYICDTILQFL